MQMGIVHGNSTPMFETMCPMALNTYYMNLKCSCNLIQKFKELRQGMKMSSNYMLPNSVGRCAGGMTLVFMQIIPLFCH